MLLRHLGEIRKGSSVHLDAFLHDFPTDAGDDLLAPRVKQPRVRNASRGHGTPELGASLDQQHARPGTARLDCCDMPRRPAPDHEYIYVVGDLGFEPSGQGLGAHIRSGRDSETKSCGS